MLRTLVFWAAGLGALGAQDPATRPAASPAARDPVATLDARGRLVVRGRPVFVHGWYSDGSVERLRRLADGGFNAVLDYGMTARPIEATRGYLAEAERLGIHVIACLNDVHPSAAYRTSLGPWRGNAEILAGVVGVVKESPAVVAYYNNDERDDALRGEIEAYAARIRELDPSRPQLSVHERPEACGVFRGSAEIFGFDHYPIPQHGPGAFGERFDAARAALGAGPPLWAVLQNFAWYQHAPTPETPVVAGDLATERARLPTPAEWTRGRPPTADEARAMQYVALVHGAQGLLWWCLYNLDFLPDRAERWEAARRLGAEVRALEPYLLADEGARATWTDPRIRAALKRGPDGRRVLLAVNVAAEPVRASVRLGPAEGPTTRPGTPAGAAPSTVEVLFEDRRAAVADAVLTDFFAPYGRHVYRLDP